MNKFNVGDLVRVIKSENQGDSELLVGMIFPVLYASDSWPALDVTSAHKRVRGFSAWSHSRGKYGWYVDDANLERLSPAAPTADTPKRSKKGRVKVDKKDKRPLSPQSSRVLDMLKAKGSITALEAAGVLRVRSLSRRIVDLKEAGHTIVRDLSKDTTGQRYARYYLKGEPAQAAA